jgi:sulfite oxidase
MTQQMAVVQPALGKDPHFLLWSDGPLNGEPPVDLLAQSFRTPLELFYVRCHGEVPQIDSQKYRLVVEGLVAQRLELSIDDLAERFEQVEVPATLHCAGNRRTELTTVAPIPGETPWREGAIGNASWSGVLLADVLAAADVQPHAAHVELLGRDAFDEDGATGVFGASIPLGVDAILATRMNGKPLEPVHGFPLRVVVPGYIGARSVKWLDRIVVRADPSPNFFQAQSYKVDGVALGDAPLNSVICRPSSGAVVAGRIVAEGWASAGAGRIVTRVEVSADDGATWWDAELAPDAVPGAWRLWRAPMELAAGEHVLVVRATDDAGATQPPDLGPLWNAKGYANNAWHRVAVRTAH